MRENLEYGLVVAVARCLGRMPRGAARCFADALAFAVYWCIGRLRRVGVRNLEMALPELSSKTRRKILRRVYVHLGWQLVEFCRMSRYTPENTGDWIRTEGLEHYLAAKARGKGVSDHYRAPGCVGVVELLPLADGLSDGDGDSQAG